MVSGSAGLVGQVLQVCFGLGVVRGEAKDEGWGCGVWGRLDERCGSRGRGCQEHQREQGGARYKGGHQRFLLPHEERSSGKATGRAQEGRHPQLDRLEGAGRLDLHSVARARFETTNGMSFIAIDRKVRHDSSRRVTVY